MSSELDPLLPSSKTAPEISGFGYTSDRDIEIKEELERDDVRQDVEGTPTGIGSNILKTVSVLFVVVILFALIISVSSSREPNPADGSSNSASLSIEARVDAILEDTPLIDGHNDLAIFIRYFFGNHIYDGNFTNLFENGMPGQVDLPRLKEGKVGGSFWSAYVGCPKGGTDFSDTNYAGVVVATLSQLDLLRRLVMAYPKTFSSPNINGSSALATFTEQHQLISPLAIEGLHQIGNSYANLRLYHSLGVRYATLTHNCHNNFADAAIVSDSSKKGGLVKAPPYWGGISKWGQEMVQEMNRMGMIVDLSHVSSDTMLDVLGGRPAKFRGSAAPVIFSHSSAYALCPHPRNVPDRLLLLVQKTKSVVMVNFSPDFISCTESNSSTGIPDLYPPNATLHQVARHIKYIGDLIGYDHVGIGSDFDGIFDTPRDLEDVSKFPHLISELLRMGIEDDDVRNVVGRNILRVWQDVDSVSLQMMKAGAFPAEDTIERSGFSLDFN